MLADTKQGAGRLRILPLLVVGWLALWGRPAWPQVGVPVAQHGPVTLVGHDAAGHLLNLQSLRGQVVAIVMLSRYTSKPAAPIQDALGPMVEPGKVEVVSVVDMIGIPGMFRGMAHKKVLAGAKGSRMQFLVDDQGTWRAYFGAQPDKRVDMLVLDQEGVLRGHFVGQEQLGETERLIRELRQREPATR